MHHATLNLGQRPRSPHATSRARKAASCPRIWHAAESQCLCIRSRNGEGSRRPSGAVPGSQHLGSSLGAREN
eukprot:scaffold76989_cov102-Phaeocystis_antarctica.AAC.5